MGECSTNQRSETQRKEFFVSEIEWSGVSDGSLQKINPATRLKRRTMYFIDH